ncbi:hypothetical protein [Ornithinimicrobium sp. INDO-MA30-4]|uniref:hypothetical protein n=1 Tax=Ornithinimicrobium sp. INDO-MA30-4 TaxID=2908651 RepID=UPI001F3DE731|nr:hypothetical protein [Ornithinimicrobium sp. INDO-MA30-4]UJH69642.1 hypothetical protein L0A91_09865 [Ornithinimicrobium sp. INDO-MA30-4]
MRAFILDNVAMWLGDFHLDGLRLDAVHELHDRRAIHILEEMAALADEVTEETDIPRSLIAESDRNDPATVAARGNGGVGGFGLHGQWADDVHHTLHVHLTGETQGYYSDFADPEALEKVLSQTPFFHDGTYSSFRCARTAPRLTRQSRLAIASLPHCKRMTKSATALSETDSRT